MNKWHIIQTRPRWEKKVYATLVEKGIECYCPLNKVTRQWSDRIKVVEQPLFKSHLFVKICDNQRVHVRITPGVVNFVYGEGKLFNIKDRDIQAIRDLLDENQYLEVLKTEAVPLLDTVNSVINPTHKINGVKRRLVVISGLNTIVYSKTAINLLPS